MPRRRGRLSRWYVARLRYAPAWVAGSVPKPPSCCESSRFREVAKELGVESKTVLAKLKEMGEFVKSASSTVEAPVARRLRAALEAGSAPAAARAPAPLATPPASPAGEPRVSARPAPPRRVAP